MMMYSDEFEDNLLEHIGHPWDFKVVLLVSLGFEGSKSGLRGRMLALSTLRWGSRSVLHHPSTGKEHWIRGHSESPCLAGLMSCSELQMGSEPYTRCASAFPWQDTHPSCDGV